jgi:hypothetical protein
MRVSLHRMGLVLTTVAGLAVAGCPSAGAETVLPEPSVTTRAVVVKRQHQRLVLVREVRIAHASRAWAVHISCPRCRSEHARPRTAWSGTTRRATGLNRLIATGRALTVTITQPSAVGRWVTLAPRSSASAVLTQVASGCADAARRPVACPIVAPVPVPLPIPPATAPTPLETQPQGGDPAGRLVSATRVGAQDVRLLGWARDPDAVDAAVLVKVEIDGAPGLQGSAGVTRPDVGAHGFDLIVPIDAKAHIVCVAAANLKGGRDVRLPGCIAVKPLGDLDGDGYIGCADVRILVAQWMQEGQSAADINGDGIVNGLDMSIMSFRFAPPPGEPPCT